MHRICADMVGTILEVQAPLDRIPARFGEVFGAELAPETQVTCFCRNETAIEVKADPKAFIVKGGECVKV